MVNVLVLKFSINGEIFLINQLINEFFVVCQVVGYGDWFIEYDFSVMVLLMLDCFLFVVLCGVVDLQFVICEVVVFFDQFIVELKVSDLLVIGVLMYNFNVLIDLKKWFDFVVWVWEIFCYIESWLQGLVEGVWVVVVSSCGGIYQGEIIDVVMFYLCVVLGLMGIQEVEFIYVEGLDNCLYGCDVGIVSVWVQIVWFVVQV